MKLVFKIDYRTAWGEALYITGNIAALGNGDAGKLRAMQLDGLEKWTLEIEVPDNTRELTYSYIVRHENGGERREWGPQRHLDLTPGIAVLELVDRWQDQPWDKPYYSSAFTDCICRRRVRAMAVEPAAGMLTLAVSAPMVPSDSVVAVSGNIPALGEWDPAKALKMSDANYPEWRVNIPLRDFSEPFEFKFLLVEKESGRVVSWEGCDNRRLTSMPQTADEALVVSGLRLVNALTPWKGAGVAIPVFALRSEEDFGVGDFIDLKAMIDWAASTGQRFVQILPINDTTMTHTWTDSYPYNANSTFALHPMFLRLEQMGILADAERRTYYATERRRLNALPQIDYEAVNNIKNAYTRELFAQDGAKTMKSAEFKAFVKKNKSWLTPYAAFCTLRDIHHTAEMERWGDMAVYDEKRVGEFIAAHTDEINYVYYLQYHLDKQLREVRDYAHSRGVAIKGDIPIGISRNSVDAWTQPRLFNLNSQAGAPPDDFSVLGQNWGLPTYNWEEMNRDGFAWWKARFSKMAEYFDAYRIDHVLGFFRIWQIPIDALHGLLGVFNPALPFTPDELRNSYDFWIDVDKQTKPFIMDWFLGDFFGEFTDEVRETYLVPLGDGRYRLRDEFSTQHKVADHFASLEKSDKNTRICEALLGLIDNVLFIEDPVEKGKYHPRISAQHTYIYRSLTDYEKWTFNRLYNDFFYRRHNDFWYGKAMWKLPALIDATDMLVCAEDLGMIPDCVPAVMKALEILALEIQRMPKDPRAEFGDTWHYPYYSVCTTSTHDMGGIRQWWEENPEKTQRFFNNVLHEGGQAPQYAEPWICAKIVELHLKSPSMLAILPLQDMLAIDAKLRRNDPREEQINVPANPRHYWRYRMHLTLDELASATEFNNTLRLMIAQGGR